MKFSKKKILINVFSSHSGRVLLKFQKPGNSNSLNPDIFMKTFGNEYHFLTSNIYFTILIPFQFISPLAEDEQGPIWCRNFSAQ